MTNEQGEDGEMARAYDALGNLTSLTLPDGRALRQHYYGSGHLTAIALDEDIISEFTRDRLHREDSRTQGRLTTYTTYNRRGFPAEPRRPAAAVQAAVGVAAQLGPGGTAEDGKGRGDDLALPQLALRGG